MKLQKKIQTYEIIVFAASKVIIIMSITGRKFAKLKFGSIISELSKMQLIRIFIIQDYAKINIKQGQKLSIRT